MPKKGFDRKEKTIIEKTPMETFSLQEQDENRKFQDIIVFKDLTFHRCKFVVCIA
jgi:hypothetical protein